MRAVSFSASMSEERSITVIEGNEDHVNADEEGVVPTKPDD